MFSRLSKFRKNFRMEKGFKIKEVYVFVSTEKDGTEGIPSVLVGTQWMPLIAGDKQRIKFLFPIASKMMAETNQDIRLRKYSTYEEVEF
jgi:hypothetical protein